MKTLSAIKRLHHKFRGVFFVRNGHLKNNILSIILLHFLFFVPPHITSYCLLASEENRLVPVVYLKNQRVEPTHDK